MKERQNLRRAADCEFEPPAGPRSCFRDSQAEASAEMTVYGATLLRWLCEQLIELRKRNFLLLRRRSAEEVC